MHLNRIRVVAGVLIAIFCALLYSYVPSRIGLLLAFLAGVVSWLAYVDGYRQCEQDSKAAS